MIHQSPDKKAAKWWTDYFHFVIQTPFVPGDKINDKQTQ